MELSNNKIDEHKSGKNSYSHSIMASVATFKSSITRIRDILRGPGMSITGMDSMRHICLYLLSRYMTKEKVASLGVPDEFAWETLIETAQTKNGGVQKALDCFYHAEEDCLVRHFDRLFGTDKFSFDIKNPQKHKEILEILNGVVMSDVDCQMDILGWVYELHLKTGSSSAGRDLGQFFTDRFICEYMTELCAPGFKHAGVPESVCDPSMGTGGFLTSFIKYYKKHHADMPINWAVQQKEIHGNDTDPRVAGVARLNLFMETGGYRPTNLLTHDSLYGDLTQTGYDVILANMPFGLKGIKHAECCERVKALKIRGTKSEPLFLQLMMVSLNRGGRCVVVVPDGMLVNSSECHDGTRKYLMEHFELKRVIKMRGQFFMNTGIQPSILFFENTGNPTTDVEFWDVIKAANGSIEETMVLSVPRERFDESCSLDMRRYQEVKEVANSAGFPMVKFSEIATFVNGYAFKSEEFKNEGVPVVKITTIKNNIITFEKAEYVNRSPKLSPYIVKEGEIVIALSGATLGIVGRNVSGVECYLNQRVAKMNITSDKVNPNYVYYYMITSDFIEKVRNLAGGSAQPNVSTKNIEELTFPLPPIETQHEIVATLDRIYQPGTTELAETLKLTNQAMDLVLAQPNGATLEPIVEAQRLMRKSAQMVADVKAQMVADVKAQMVAIVKASCVSGNEKQLSELAKLKNGFPFSSSDYTTEGLAVVKHNNLTDGYVSISKKQDYIPSSGQTDDYKMVVGDIVISMDFDCGKVGKIVEDGWVLNQRVCLVRTSDDGLLRQEYLYWLLRFGGFYENMQSVHTGTTIKHIRGKDIDTAKIKVPSVLLQDSTLARLTLLQSQLTALESLQRQSEDNARFILESYLGSANDSANSVDIAFKIEESKEDVESDSDFHMNEIIHPVESIATTTVVPSVVPSKVNVVLYKRAPITKLKKSK
jgi:restriction endonuclease S subunit